MRESDLRIAGGKWDSDNGIISGKLLIFRFSLHDKIQQSTFVLRPGTLMKNQKIFASYQEIRWDQTQSHIHIRKGVFVYAEMQNVRFATTPIFPSFLQCTCFKD